MPNLQGLGALLLSVCDCWPTTCCINPEEEVLSGLRERDASLSMHLSWDHKEYGRVRFPNFTLCACDCSLRTSCWRCARAR